MPSSGRLFLVSDSDTALVETSSQQLLQEGPYGDAILCALVFSLFCLWNSYLDHSKCVLHAVPGNRLLPVTKSFVTRITEKAWRECLIKALQPWDRLFKTMKKRKDVRKATVIGPETVESKSLPPCPKLHCGQYSELHWPLGNLTEQELCPGTNTCLLNSNSLAPRTFLVGA